MYDVDLIDSCGVTPLMDAVRGDHVELSELLISEWTVCVLKECLFIESSSVIDDGLVFLRYKCRQILIAQTC